MEGKSNAQNEQGRCPGIPRRARDRGPLRRAGRLHGGVRDAQGRHGPGALLPGPAGRPVPVPALGHGAVRPDHLPVPRPRRGLHGRGRLLRRARAPAAAVRRDRTGRVQPDRPAQRDHDGRRQEPRSGQGLTWLALTWLLLTWLLLTWLLLTWLAPPWRAPCA